MDPKPVLSLDPDDIKGELTKKQNILLGHSFVALVNYVEEQHARCGTPVSR